MSKDGKTNHRTIHDKLATNFCNLGYSKTRNTQYSFFTSGIKVANIISIENIINNNCI